jgi:hypothetical protein
MFQLIDIITLISAPKKELMLMVVVAVFSPDHGSKPH